MLFASPWMAKACNPWPPVSLPRSPAAAMALTDPPIPPLPSVDESDTLTPKSSSHTSSSCGLPTTPNPGVHPSSRATWIYLFSASDLWPAYVFPVLLHASHFARPAKSNSDGRGPWGTDATVRYLYNPYSCRCATPRLSGVYNRPNNGLARPQALWYSTPLPAGVQMTSMLPPQRVLVMAYIP